MWLFLHPFIDYGATNVNLHTSNTFMTFKECFADFYNKKVLKQIELFSRFQLPIGKQSQRNFNTLQSFETSSRNHNYNYNSIFNSLLLLHNNLFTTKKIYFFAGYGEVRDLQRG